jgi:hypothetical protein
MKTFLSFILNIKLNSILRKNEKLNNFGVLNINLRVPLGYILFGSLSNEVSGLIYTYNKHNIIYLK